MKVLVLFILCLPLMVFASAYDMERADQVDRQGWKLDFLTDSNSSSTVHQHDIAVEKPKEKITIPAQSTSKAPAQEKKGKMHL